MCVICLCVCVHICTWAQVLAEDRGPDRSGTRVIMMRVLGIRLTARAVHTQPLSHLSNLIFRLNWSHHSSNCVHGNTRLRDLKELFKIKMLLSEKLDSKSSLSVATLCISTTQHYTADHAWLSLLIFIFLKPPGIVVIFALFSVDLAHKTLCRAQIFIS